MAVSANENSIKILANSDGIRLLRPYENIPFDASRAADAASKVNGPYWLVSHESASSFVSEQQIKCSCSQR